MCTISKQKIATLFRVILVKKPFLPSSITLGKNWFCIAWWCCKNTVAWNVSPQFHGKSENYWVTGIFNKRLRWVLQKTSGHFFTTPYVATTDDRQRGPKIGKIHFSQGYIVPLNKMLPKFLPLFRYVVSLVWATAGSI